MNSTDLKKKKKKKEIKSKNIKRKKLDGMQGGGEKNPANKNKNKPNDPVKRCVYVIHQIFEKKNNKYR